MPTWNRSCRTLLAALVAVAVAAFAATGTTRAGDSGVTCGFDAAMHNLTVTFHYDHAEARIFRDGRDLVVDDFIGPRGCAGMEDPTRFNTERVSVRNQAPSTMGFRLYLQLQGGPFAPGFTGEGLGSSEIEFAVSFPAGSRSWVWVSGRKGRDRIILGRLADDEGANLNAAEDADDSDVTLTGGSFLVHASRGADVVSGRGGGGFIGPYGRPVVALGDRGDDLLKGGPKGDRLIGGSGHDTIKGGRGKDLLRSRDHERDRVRCGPGVDVAEVDRIDRVRGCEHVQTS
jgi:RTX calcium-binding nonapeptide repeat (4 copies)